MTQKKSYSRYFIILQEDEKGYALGSDKLPSGYAKLEVKNDKCKISYYVQNLKRESTPYFMVLICNKKDVKKIIKIGELNIDEHGRTEVSYEYPVENVANSSIGVDKVVGAAIVRFMNTNPISVMSGFTSTEIPDWKGFVVVEEEIKRHIVQPAAIQSDKELAKPEAQMNQMQEEMPQKMPQQMSQHMPEHMPVEIPAEMPSEVMAKSNIFDEYESKIEVEKAEPIELLPVEEEPIEVSNGTEQENNNMAGEYYNEEDLRHKKHCKDETKHEQKHKKEDAFKGIMGDFFKELADGFEELEGICEEVKRCKWYKVPVNRFEDLHSCHNYNKHTVVFYPMLSYFPYIGKHKHFILGYKFDVENKMKYLVYGIPGRRAKVDQPFGGRSGFVTWVPLIPGQEEEHNMGYWLMFYDFKNSTIVVPVK